MTAAQRPTPEIVEIDMAALDAMLDRAHALLSPEDYECLCGLAGTLVDLMRLVRKRGTTIARLRRLFDLRSSEKTADVLRKGERHGQQPSTPPPTSSSASASATSDAEDTPEATTSMPIDPTEAPDDSRDEAAGDDGGASLRPRPGHGRLGAAAYPHAHRVAVAHDKLKPGGTCPSCPGGRLYRLAEPARIVRIVGQPPLAAHSWECERLRCSSCGDVFTANAPQQARGPKYDETAASMMALLRYGSGMPLNRLDRLQRNLETPVPASTQWEVVRDHAAALEPAYQELYRRAAQGTLLHNDDTSVRILDFMGRRRAKLLAAGELEDPERSGLFTTGIVSITADGPVVLFFSGRKHAGENLAALMKERDSTLSPPVLMCDALDRNLPTGHTVVEVNCLAHGRRHVVDEVANFPDKCGHVLEELGKVFQNEAECKKRGLRGQERLDLHQRQSAPVLKDLQKWMQAELDDKLVEPNSGLGQALRYLLRRWDKLTAFLRVPDAPLDNNLCERILKMAIRHRNNSLFYRSQRGAKVGDLYMTLIYTAELHGDNPFEYLTALLRHEADVAENPAAWLPWTFRATLAALAVDKAARRAA